MNSLPIIYSLLFFFLFSCQDHLDQKESSPSSVTGTALKKTETILANNTNVKNISLSNDAGEVEILNGPLAKAQYLKVEWREWCVLSHKEENGAIKLKVENTSFTGDGGCKLKWQLVLPKEGVLSLQMAAGSIKGQGQLKALKVQLAAGNLTWKNGEAPLNIQVAAGTVNLENMRFPNDGASSIEVGTGQVKITSPQGTKVTTITEKALGQSENDFKEEVDGHKLSLEVAVGQVSHKAK